MMVCNDRPNQNFPFDVQHRTIIRYKTESDQDFHALREQITARLRAAILKKNTLGQLAQSSVLAEIAGLNSLEVVALATIAENADAPDSFVPAYTIRRDMESQGYTKVAVTLSAATLLKKQMLENETRGRLPRQHGGGIRNDRCWCGVAYPESERPYSAARNEGADVGGTPQ